MCLMFDPYSNEPQADIKHVVLVVECDNHDHVLHGGGPLLVEHVPADAVSDLYVEAQLLEGPIHEGIELVAPSTSLVEHHFLVERLTERLQICAEFFHSQILLELIE